MVGLIFCEVPEDRTVKNRLPLDLRPSADATLDDEVDRLQGAGATEVADHRGPDGPGCVVLADPEGNEFCVLRSEAEVAAREAAGGAWLYPGGQLGRVGVGHPGDVRVAV